MLSKLQEELKTALKAGEKSRMIGLRNIIGKLKARQIDKGEELTETESLKIMQTAGKQLKESIRQYKEGGRDDLVEIEEFELSILERFLPRQMSAEKITEAVRNTIQPSGAAGPQNMGKVMGMIMKELSGAADGKMVQDIVKEELNR